MWGWLKRNATNLLGIGAGAAGQHSANRSNERIARENREFQERMSSTSIRRAMADMKAGGLNPILAGKWNASTPSGATATMGNVGAAGVEGGQKTAAAKQSKAAARLADAQKTVADATIGKLSAEKAKLLEEANSAQQHAIQAALQTRLDMELKRLDTEIYKGAEGKLLRRAQLYQAPANSARQIMRQ